jgi:hypothetical protein
MTGAIGPGAATPAPGTPNTPKVQPQGAPTDQKTAAAVDKLRAFAAEQPAGAGAANVASPPATASATPGPVPDPSPALRDAIQGALARNESAPVGPSQPAPVVEPAPIALPQPAPVEPPPGGVHLPSGAQPAPHVSTTDPATQDDAARDAAERDDRSASDAKRDAAPDAKPDRSGATPPPPPEPPRQRAPKTDRSPAEPPKVQAPKTEPPKVELPKVELPKVEHPKASERPTIPRPEADARASSTGGDTSADAVPVVHEAAAATDTSTPKSVAEHAPPTPPANRVKELLAGDAPDTADERRWVTRTREQMRELAPHINELVETMGSELAAGRDDSKVRDAVPAAVQAATTAGYAIEPNRRSALLDGARPASAEEEVFVGGIALVIQQMLATVNKLVAARQAELARSGGAAAGGGATTAASFASPLALDKPGDPATGIDELPLRASVVGT